MNLLGSIALDRDYSLSPIGSIGNFFGWNIQLGTLISSDGTHLNVSSTSFSFATMVGYSQVSDIATYQNGNNYRATITINPSVSGSVSVVPYEGGFALPYQCFSPSYHISAGSQVVNFDFSTDGYSFNEIRVRFFSDVQSAFTIDHSAASLATTDSTFASFTPGDIINVYWTGSDYYVERLDNGVATQITTGPNLGVLGRDQFTGGSIPRDPAPGQRSGFFYSDYSYCDNLDLITFACTLNAPDFPYMILYRLDNNAQCTASQIVNDIEILSIVVDNASTNFSADGSILMVATSAYPIKYVKGTFLPQSPSYQYSNLNNTTGLFEGLIRGLYQITAVNQYNFYKSITAVVGVDASNVYSAKYRVQFTDIHTKIQSTVDILERGYTGDPLISIADSDPFTLSKNQGELNDKFDVIRPTFSTVTLISERHYQYIGLFNQDDTKYKVLWTHGSSSWSGFLVPSVYQEEYLPNNNYAVSLSFGDNLANLNQYDFVDSGGNVFTGTNSLRYYLLQILKKTSLDLNVRIAVNKYASGMSTSIDSLGQTYISANAFLDDNDDPVKCDEAIQIILKPLGAFIIQKDSRWNVIDLDSQTSSYTYYEYTSENVYVGTGTIDPKVYITQPSFELDNVLFSDRNHNLEIIPAYGKITITQKLKLKKSIFPTSLDKWQINSAAGGTGNPYDISGTRNKGMRFANFGTSYVDMISPTFQIASGGGDIVKIALEYAINLVRYASFTDPVTGIKFTPQNVYEPPWIRLQWSLLMTVDSVDYYFSEWIGWNRLAAVGTSTTSVAIPTSHPFSKTFTTQTGLSFPVGSVLKLTHDNTHYFRATVTSYDSATGSLVVDSYSNNGTGTFATWTIYAAGVDFKQNYVYATDYSGFQNFDKEVQLPFFTSVTTVTFQLNLTVRGSRTKDFTTIGELHSLPTSVYPVGFRIMGADPSQSNYQRWYTLRTGTDAESSPSIIRGDDFNSTSNAVVWDSSSNSYPYVNEVSNIQVQGLLVTFYPAGLAPSEEIVLQLNNNTNLKENLEYEVLAGDVGTNLKELYENVFLLSDGSATYGWARSGFSETNYNIEILMKNLSNQYTKPSWRLGGNFLAPDLSFISIIQHTVAAAQFYITNPENPNGTGWSQAGVGQAWIGSSGFCQVDFSPVLVGNSTYVKQPQTTYSGIRIRIDFSLERLSSSGSRTDRFCCVLLRSGSVVQKVTLADGISLDTTIITGVLFNLDSDADEIGFFIENISGSGTCSYRVDYFRGVGVSSVRYYFLNKVNRSDRHNLYQSELVQLIPAVVSSDPEIDDTGGGNTGGNQDGNLGGAGGNAFNSGFSSGFGFG